MRVSKICLIIPPSPFLLDERVFPFLGILKVAAAWREQGANIDVLDLSGIENYLDVIKEYFDNRENVEFAGITATTPQMPNAFDIGKYIQSNWPHIKLVLGGSHVTLMHTASKREKSGGRATNDIDRIKQYFDVLVCGDGEMTLEAVREVDEGIIDVDDKKSPLFLTNETFSKLPNPARDLIDMDSYNYSIAGERATSLISQLGCPFRCHFCSGRSSPYLRLIRNRSVKSVVDELEGLYLKYGYKGYMFYDDELNVNKEMVPLMREIRKLADKHGIEFKLRGFTKAELFTDEQAEAMYAAGFRWLLTGFESGDSKILKIIEKNATIEDNTRCVEIAKRHGLKVKALMSMGHAGESYETIENTKKWLLEVKPDDFDCTVITTYPGSPYFDRAVLEDDVYVYTSPKSGEKLYQANLDYTEKADYYKGTPGDYTSYVWTDYLSPKELARARDDLEEEVREKLGIPYNPANPAKKFEHSMGSSKNILPDWILRSAKGKEQKKKKLGLSVIK